MITLQLTKRQAEKVAGSLRASLTYTLDALGASLVDPFGMDSVEANLTVREDILQMLEQLGKPADDSYRMGHIVEFAESEGHPKAAALIRMAS